MIDRKNGIYFGTSCFLVKDSSLSSNCDFVNFLYSEGFSIWSKHGFYDYAKWVYVNINSKIFAPGMPGIKLCDTVGNHAVTVEEFKCIYNILKKYERLSPLQFWE